ncbi:hypothetical protein [Streptomyces sp. NPDC055692]|uniref:hypothetical protein n=1 Tax=Streptomyces sp. NPDC055692 TaxID=3155683 RepID=UPI003423CC4F
MGAIAASIVLLLGYAPLCLVRGASRTGGIPLPLRDGCTEAERDAVRAYAHWEWRAREERHGVAD